MLLKELYNRGPKLYPEKVAIIDGDRRFTYRQWSKRHNQFANALQALGLKKGDVLGVLLKNGAEYMDALAATAKTGVILGGINFRLNTEGVRGILEDLGCRVLLVDHEYADMIGSLRPQVPFLETCISVGCIKEGMVEYESLLQQYPTTEPEVPTREDDPDLIVYTSGTTGVPKGCVTTRKNTMVRVSGIALEGNLNPEDRYMNVFPIFHVGVNITQTIVFVGGTNVFMRDWDVREFCRLVQEEKINKTTLAPVFLNFIINFPDLAKYDLSSLEYVRYGAAPMPTELLKRAYKILPNCEYFQALGSSETFGMTGFSQKDHRDALTGSPEAEEKLASCGRQLYFCITRVVNEDGRDVKPGEVGEIITQGANIMRGYWNKPEETSEKIKDGWLHSGDLATLDEEGYIYIVDRKNNMIITGGENVYPAQVEAALLQIPQIDEAAVLGVPDEKWGESVKAIVKVKDGEALTYEKIMDLCKDKMANYARPKSVDFVNELPHLATGKVDRVTLKNRYCCH